MAAMEVREVSMEIQEAVPFSRDHLGTAVVVSVLSII